MVTAITVLPRTILVCHFRKGTLRGVDFNPSTANKEFYWTASAKLPEESSGNQVSDEMGRKFILLQVT